ncbi:MAG TPA: glycoside hydrolase family 15 protein [Thermoplasmata archaeon]|nr:glycoside hydrolase family 15 protein [Thermoplasmata archaeon]
MDTRGDRVAFGGPGIEPRWSHSNKDGVGTAYSADSRLWYTLWRGIVTEAYYPRIDRPQLRDLEYLVTDGATFFHEEKRHLLPVTERPTDHALVYQVTSDDPEGRYRIHKTVLSDPHLPCLLLNTRFELRRTRPERELRLFALAAPHLDGGGWGNNAAVYEVLGQPILAAERNGVAVALGASVPFLRASVGYVGASDAWTDLSQHRALTWEFDQAPNGNVALVGELPVHRRTQFTLGLAFGESVAAAVTSLFQSLSTPFENHRRRFVDQWNRPVTSELPLGANSHDGGRLYRGSRSILLAHEDKIFPGAFIASLSIPWGAAKSDEERGGYHLVWTRDMVHSALALLASGHPDPARRALVYLATRQRADGGFPQNFWVDGTPYWQGVQLDEVALPILLSWHLWHAGALDGFDPFPMVRRAARFLIERGPVTQEDRWEEVGGFSPSTLAASIAALTAAAHITRLHSDSRTANFIQEYADFLESHVERWTVTERGTLVPGTTRHYVRVRPAAVDDPTPDEGPDLGWVRLPNVPPGASATFPASEIVDSGFLDLVRFGIRRPNDTVIVDSVDVVDRVLRVDTPFGPAWYRYNHDGYGEREDGGPYADWGIGRLWPLLTGERGHYELALGNDPGPYLRAMERFATSTGLLSEQVWDSLDRPSIHLEIGRPTEAAMPLLWAHAEYVSLLRSAADRKVFDLIPEVAERYRESRIHRPAREVWTFARQPSVVDPEAALRVIASQPFRLHASDDAWGTTSDLDSIETGIGLHYADLAPLGSVDRSWTFTFYWPFAGRWEGRDYRVDAASPVTPP